MTHVLLPWKVLHSQFFGRVKRRRGAESRRDCRCGLGTYRSVAALLVRLYPGFGVAQNARAGRNGSQHLPRASSLLRSDPPPGSESLHFPSRVSPAPNGPSLSCVSAFPPLTSRLAAGELIWVTPGELATTGDNRFVIQFILKRNLQSPTCKVHARGREGVTESSLLFSDFQLIPIFSLVSPSLKLVICRLISWLFSLSGVCRAEHTHPSSCHSPL